MDRDRRTQGHRTGDPIEDGVVDRNVVPNLKAAAIEPPGRRGIPRACASTARRRAVRYPL